MPESVAAQWQARRIALNIEITLPDGGRIPNHVVKILFQPDVATAVSALVDPAGADGLPCLDNPAQALALQRLHKDMHVVGHNDKCPQPIFDPVAMPQGRLDGVLIGRIVQQAFPEAGVHHLLKAQRPDTTVFLLLLWGMWKRMGQHPSLAIIM